MIKLIDGVRKDKMGRFRFDKAVDLDMDIVELTKDISGIKSTNNLTFFYAYEFKDGTNNRLHKEFRDALKYNVENTAYFHSDELSDFVEDGVFRLDDYKRLDDFKVLVSVKPTFTEQRTLLDLITLHIEQYSSNEIISFELLKRKIKDVTFDAERALEALKRTNKYGNWTEEELIAKVYEVADKFNDMDSEEKFTIKKYLPVVVREGFINYLNFKNKYDEEIYRNLDKGTEVLIVDDFITSGSTLKEMIRFLNTINPNNKITVFAFMNQLREY